jgi:hypothetical protein
MGRTTSAPRFRILVSIDNDLRLGLNMVTSRIQHYRTFWQYLARELPELGERLERGNESSRWLSVTSQPITISHYLASDSVGIFVRAQRGANIASIMPFLQSQADRLASALETDFHLKGSNELLWRRMMLDMSDEGNWPLATTWLAEWSPRYEAALRRRQ